MTFSCTKKVLVKLKGIKQISTELDEIHLNNWYVNWLTLFRKRFALVTNSETLFNVLMYCGTKSELKNFEQLFITKLNERIIEQTLLKKTEISKLDLNPNHFKFTKTNSARVLGNMNEFIQMTKYYTLTPENMEMETKILNQKMNTLPMSNLKYKSPKEVMVKTLLNQIK